MTDLIYFNPTAVRVQGGRRADRGDGRCAGHARGEHLDAALLPREQQRREGAPLAQAPQPSLLALQDQGWTVH